MPAKGKVPAGLAKWMKAHPRKSGVKKTTKKRTTKRKK